MNPRTAPLRATELAAATPEDRNRVVDFLRAAAILVVVAGHWLMAGLYLDGAGRMRRADLLDEAAWTHPLTWVLQVMPLFFLVGGYANALSWRSARQRGRGYGEWLRARLRRLTLPVLPLLLFWAVAAPTGHALGLSLQQLRIATTAALVPTWFLAAYVVVVSITPWALAAWEDRGWWTVALALGLGGLIDWISVSLDRPLIGFANYLVVWGAVHQLGFAWLDGRLAGTGRRLLLGAIGLVGLLVLAVLGPYAVAMVGFDAGDQINNTYPARVTMGFLGLMQAGFVLAFEPQLRRLLQRRRVWLATVLVNGRIMTVYLWHLTVLGAVAGLAQAFGGLGLHARPFGSQWWGERPLWFAVLGLGVILAIALLGRFEQPGPDPRPAPPAWRPVAAMVAFCAGLGVLADWGIATEGEVRWWLPLLPVAAAYVFGVAGASRSRWQHSAQPAAQLPRR